MRTAWPIRKLEDVVDIFNGSTPLRGRDEYWNSPDVSWFTIDDIREQGRIISSTRQFVSNEALESTSLKLLPPKTTLLCCTASVGEYAFSEIPLTTNQQFNGLVVNRENSTKILPKYIFYFAGTLKDKLLKSGGKTSFDYVSVGNLKKIELAIPDLQTQKKIVERLDEIRKAQELNDQLISKTQELFESTLYSAFANAKDFLTGSINDISKVVTDYVANGSFASIKKNVQYSRNIDYAVLIRLVDNSNNFSGSFVYVNRRSYEFLRKSKLHPGDLILSNVGARLGTVFKAPDLGVPMTLGPNSILIRTIGLDDYLFYWLMSAQGKSAIKHIVSGAGQPKFNKTDFKKITLPIPKNEQINIKIVEKLDAIQNYKSLLLKQKKLYQELFNFTLHKSLSGELD